MPTVSVVIPNYNGRHHLETLLPSVLNQTIKSYEVILVDDASIDGSVDYVRTNFPEVRIIRNRRNQGVAYTMNKGAEKSRGEYLTFLGTDQRVPPDYLEKLLTFMQKHKAKAVCCTVYSFNFRTVQFEGGWIDIWGRPRAYGKPHRDGDEVFWATSGAFMIRKDLFIQLEGFDPHLRVCEDVEFSLRLRHAGYRILYTTQTYTLHKHSTVAIPQKDRPRINREARYYILRKHGLWIKIPASVIWDIKSMTASTIKSLITRVKS